MSFSKFERRIPCDQTAIDIFAGKWASNLAVVMPVGNTGSADLFGEDPRPKWAAQTLGTAGGRLDDMRVLEIGPLEGGHSYQLEKLGAAYVLGIDSNAEAYLKCLIVKEALGLAKCHFLLGDALEYMRVRKERFDLVFCSGVLYHMRDPISLIEACCSVSDRCFVWTHYYNAERGNVEGARTPRAVMHNGFAATYHELVYPNPEIGTFWGGTDDTRAWMEREEIFACFRHYGLTNIDVLQDDPGHIHGAAMSFAAQR